MRKIYRLDHLACANCAAKMEHKIKALPGVEDAAVSFVTKQLHLAAENHAALLPKIQTICDAIEPGVKVEAESGAGSAAETTETYLLEHLDCANCAAKIEAAINALPGVSRATVTFATKQLKLTARSPKELLPAIRQACAAIEGRVRIMERNAESMAMIAAGEESRRKRARTRSLAEIGLGALIFIVVSLLDFSPYASMPAFIAAYAILGGRIVWTAAKNITRGHVFDENFLMSAATLGAFAIQAYPEAVGVMLFYRIGEYFERMAVEKSRGEIMGAVDLRPEVVNLLKDGEVKVIDAKDAGVGDILLVRPGDRIPLDGVVVSGESRIDTSAVTGEPVPVKAEPGDSVISGCVNTSGALHIRVEKVLAESMVTRILNSVENAAAGKPKIDRFITRFARVYTPLVVAAAALTAIVPSLITGDWSYWIYAALTFLVISCPCALVLSVPLAFFSGIGAGSKRGILFKGGASLEAIGRVKAVVMDKTGTITKGRFELQSVIPEANMDADRLLALCAASESFSTHPIATSIVKAAKERGLKVERPEKVEEIAGRGARAFLPTGEALCGNRSLLAMHGVMIGADADKEVFGAEVFVAHNGEYIGRLVVADAVKEDAARAIGAIKRLGIKTAMLTGDSLGAAEAVAKQTGIDEVHAKLLPEDKLSELKKIRQTHGAVMFVGDGINDAPVLAGADAGAAMGSGADAAIEAADAVFMTSKMEAVPQAITIARATSTIAWQNVAVALGVKALVMILGLFGYASMWMAVFADTGVSMLCVLNSMRILYKR